MAVSPFCTSHARICDCKTRSEAVEKITKREALRPMDPVQLIELMSGELRADVEYPLTLD